MRHPAPTPEEDGGEPGTTSTGPLHFALDASPSSWAAAQRRGDRHAIRQAVDRTIELARIADVAGIESIWLLEDPDGWDAFAVLGAMARATERIRLGTGVTNPYYRHPALLAASVATLDLLSDGRAFLGLGRGQAEWYERSLGMKVGKPVRALRESFGLLRQWWSPGMRATSEDADTEFAIDDWERVFRPLQSRMPVYLAAVGPLALKLAGECADGVLFNDLSSIQFMREAIRTVRDAASASGRDPATLSFYARASVTITSDPEALYERRKSTIAAIHVLPGMERLLESPGWDTARIIADVRRAMRTAETLDRGGGFGDLRRAGDLDAAKRAIPTGLMHELVVAGSVEEVRARLAQFQEIGITHVFLTNQGSSATVESLGQLLRDLG
ncbi:MAG: LLM class flavin-dependent oxidoreductase [Chloroflexota bacterium]|nr:LLM class flavin-dependent oxidoreductase [Chloroflexota bacterium]